MKHELKDITFCFLIRLDSIQRLENIIAVTDSIIKYYDTNVIVLEVAHYNNGILKKMLNRKISYNFIIDKDPVLHKTRYFNSIINELTTTYIAIWDVDIVVDKIIIDKSINILRLGEADVVLPYNGKCYEVSQMLRSLYFKKKSISFLHRNLCKMDLLYEKTLVGGAVLVNREKYICAGMENEKHYGWGNDDFDRYARFLVMGFSIHREDAPLFHLWHPRGINSQFSSHNQGNISSSERFKMENSSKYELQTKGVVKPL